MRLPTIVRFKGLLVLLLIASLCGMSASPAQAQLRGATPELLKVTDRVYVALGFALGNVSFIVTDNSVVVVDTTESPDAAQATLTELRKITHLPIRTIIYSHFHGDHINGAVAFRPSRDDKLDVIAQRNHIDELAMYQKARNYNMRLNAIQFGSSLPQRDPTLELAMDPLRPTIGYIRPTTYFDQEYKFEEGGVRFELYSTSGETSDHLMLWLPDLKVLFPGDLYYASFPMLSSPMKHARPVLEWAESIDRMRLLSPEYLVPSHTQPIEGKKTIDTVLANYFSAIRHVHDETLKCINEGISVAEARERVKLPDSLASLPYLAERYGRVSWSVDGIYRYYTGWYDQIPAHLNSQPTAQLHRAIAAAAGGVEPIYKQALQAHDAGNDQLSLELLTIALDVEASHQPSRTLIIQVLRQLAARSSNGVERNIYLGAVQAHESYVPQKVR